MDGLQCFTINPSTFEDELIWSYADLQKLCKALEIKASGKRIELVKRLQEWHKARTDDGHSLLGEGEQNYPLNVNGSNFSIYKMYIQPRTTGVLNSVPSSPQKSTSCATSNEPSSIKKVTSLVGLSESSPLVVSPTLLRPLAPTTPVRTPSKSILKAPGSEGKASRIKFSPYNGTKVIPNRRDEIKGIHAQMEEHEGSAREHYRSRNVDEEEDEDDWEDEERGYVDETARLNAEKNVFVCSLEDSWDNGF